ncbi:hypothetical protein CFP56_019508 [Quercus suber]|uniref:Uncharacterized protein n=1 Tax=Quercus suber TaxID=58331 RepID=A0AAW0KHL7_QUESU
MYRLKLHRNILSKEILKIVENEYFFQLHLNEYSSKYGRENYIVSRILEPEIPHKQIDSHKIKVSSIHRFSEGFIDSLYVYSVQSMDSRYYSSFTDVLRENINLEEELFGIEKARELFKEIYDSRKEMPQTPDSID